MHNSNINKNITMKIDTPNIFNISFNKCLFLKDFINNTTTYSLKDSKNIPLDIKLKDYLCFPRGIFIEVGSHDGINQNITKIYEDLFGWKGLLIEPSKDVYLQCKVNRNNSHVENYAIVNNNNPYIEGDFTGHILSSINGNRLGKKKKKIVKVPSCTLDYLILKHKIPRIDFICIDTNGTEMDVLQSLDLSKHVPKYILIQFNPKNLHKILDYFNKYNYKLLENLSNYNKKDNPRWNGTHNDYLFEYELKF